MRHAAMIFACFVLLAVIGCSSSEDTSTVSGTPTPAQPQQAAPMSNADLTIDTSASGISGEVSDKDLESRKKTYTDAKAAFTKKATPETTDDYIIATASYGSATMLAGSLDAKTKYRGALALYREAMKPSATGDKAKKFSAEAKKNEGVIVAIYKMMGRQVPQ